MARKTKAPEAEALAITTKREAIAALERMEEIQRQIEPLMAEQVMLKKNATAYAAAKKVDVLQLDDVYFRLITRVNKAWDVDLLKEITADVKVRGKSLFLKVTKRVPDTEAIERAVKSKWITEEEISAAFVEKPQQPFLQKFTGVADDG